MATFIIPASHPPILKEVNIAELIAIVSVHDTQAVSANRNTPHHKTRIAPDSARPTTRQAVTGVTTFLRRIHSQVSFVTRLETW
jgi:hypothetical protein